MKKFLVLGLVLMCLFVTGCGKKEPSTDGGSKSKKKYSYVTLQPDNEYYTVTDLDFSKCKYENGYFSGQIYFNITTTDKYVEKYNDYGYIKIFFEFIDSENKVVAVESIWKAYLYEEDIEQDYDHFMVESKNPIKDVKIKKLELHLAEEFENE